MIFITAFSSFTIGVFCGGWWMLSYLNRVDADG